MRRFLPRLALCLTLVAPVVCLQSFAQTAEGTQMKVLPQAELDVIKVMLAQEHAWNLGDLEGFAKSYKNSPEILFIGHNVARGYDGMVANYKKNYPDQASMGKLTFSDLEPHILDDRYAIVTGRFALERSKKNGGNDSGIFSLVFENTKDGWKIILDHTS